jgi:hemoglobin-like flavoprotein
MGKTVVEEITATEMLTRIQNAIKEAEDRINASNERLEALNQRSEELYLDNAVIGGKDAEIQQVNDEIVSLKDEITRQNRLIDALRAKLSEIEKQARIENAVNVDIAEYNQIKENLQEFLNEIPDLDTIKTEIKKLEAYEIALSSLKNEFLKRCKNIADFMQTEKLDNLNDVNLQSLRNDRALLDCKGILTLSDSIIDLIEMLNSVQYRLFATATYNPLELRIPEPVDPDTVPDVNGRFKRVREGKTWLLYEKTVNSFGHEDWSRIYTGWHKPDFPERRDNNGNWIITYEIDENYKPEAVKIWEDEEKCGCMKHRRRYHTQHNMWYLEEYTKDSFGKTDWKLIDRGYGKNDKPEFPCGK